MLHTFSATGLLVQIASPRGTAHQLTYVGGQLASVSDGLGRTLTFSYSVTGALTNLSDGTRNVGFAQTGGLLTAAVSPLGFTTTYAYDMANTNSGLLIAWTNPVGNVPFVQRYDAQGRVTNQTDGGQFTTVLAYNGLNTTVTDPRGNARVHIHDAEGNLLTSRDEASLSLSLSLAYNPAGQRSAVTDRLGDTIGIGYHTASGLPAAITCYELF